MPKIILLFCSMFTILFSDTSSAKVVYDLTTSELQIFERKILKAIVANKSHYESDFRDLDVTVVIHGEAYRYFTIDPTTSDFKEDTKLVATYKELAKRIKSMADTYDVVFLMCGAGMPSHGLKPNDIYSFVKIIPNSTIGLINKQNEGYAYIPVGNK